MSLAPVRAAHAVPADPDTLRAIAIAEDRRADPDGCLARALRASDVVIRRRAALAIGRLQDSTWVGALLPLLADPDPEARHEAIFALGQIGHRSAREPLERVLGGADVETATLAIEALGKLGDRAATPAVVKQLDSAHPALRAEAAVALWRLADSTALEPLIAHHRDPDPEVRWRVLYALEKIPNPARIVLVAALHLEDPEDQTRAQAARTIGRQKSIRGTAYLLQKVSDVEPAVVVNAIRALQQIADSTCSSCGPILAAALAHPHPYVRVIAATALGERFAWVAPDSARRRAMMDSLGRHLADADAATRGACAHTLLARGASFTGVLAARFDDSSRVTRVAVLQALALLPQDHAALLLTPRLAATTPLLERMTAAEVLGQIHWSAAIPALRTGLADTSLLYVASCAGALADLGDTASVAPLAAAYAVRARDADADARIAIRDALRQLAGQPYADSVERVNPVHAPAVDYAADFAEPPLERGAVLHTTAGDIEWVFYGREAPQTVKNFVRLARRGYFDGSSFHRVVPNFVIQDGDPTGTGAGGPGYTIRCEYNRLRYDPGMVGMALSGKDTGGSQWFITHAPQLHLNGRYTIFGRVTRGMDVVRRTVQGDRILKVELLR